MEALTITLILFATLIFIIYLYFKQKFGFWKNLGFPYIEPNFPLGNFYFKMLLKNIPFFDFLQKHYIETKKCGSRYIGMYFYSKPQLLIVDPELIKHILTTDFQSFNGRGLYYDEDVDPLSATIVALDGKIWKNVRTKLAPSFTSGKLKNMFQLITEQGQELIKLLKNEKIIDIKELVSSYATDAIGSIAFGLNCDSLKNANSKFRRFEKRSKYGNIFDAIRRTFLRSFPSLAKKLGTKVVPTEISKFFMNTFLESIEYRKIHKIQRNDFLQLLIDLIELNNDGKDGFTLNEAAAQALFIFKAGLETSAITTTFAMYELATNVDIQEKLRNEIKETLGKNNGEISYDVIIKMSFMDKVIQETLRKWSTIPFLIRKCNKAYKIPHSNHVIPKDMIIFVPTCGIHHDPDIYQDPSKFNPDRFINNDVLRNIKNSYDFLPFGNGPRICMGVRFALLIMKVALTMMLNNYKFTLNNKTTVPFKFERNPVILSIQNDVWLNVRSLHKS